MKYGLFLVLALAVCVGCRSGGDAPSAPADNPGPEVPAPIVQTKPKKKAFSWKNALQFVGFNQSLDDETTAEPRLMEKLSSFVNTVVAQANALNANDPPEVTRIKAQKLLDSLRPWNNLRSAGISTGVLNAATAQQLDLWIEQLRMEASKLIEFTPNAETIAGVKYLARMLSTTFGQGTEMIARGSNILRAFRSAPVR